MRDYDATYNSVHVMCTINTAINQERFKLMSIQNKLLAAKLNGGKVQVTFIEAVTGKKKVINVAKSKVTGNMDVLRMSIDDCAKVVEVANNDD